MGNRWDYEKCKEKALGQEGFNVYGEHMVIISYNGQRHIEVLFDNGGIKQTSYSNFKRGYVKNPLSPSVCGVGIVGNMITKINGKHIKEYKLWHNMLIRCYKNDDAKAPTYADVTCSKEWLYFPTFYNWVHSQDNFKKLMEDEIEFQLDKDILVKGNKLYSANTCCLVPRNINMLFTKRKAKRGDTPIGVVKNHHKNDSFISICSNPYGDDYVHYGFTNVYDAFEQYKNDKEMIIKQVAKTNYELGYITQKCYEAMMHYEVEITD